MIREKKPKDHREAEQEVLLKNWLDGLEPLKRTEVQEALRHAPALSTIEDVRLEAIPSHEPFDVDRPEWILAEELNLGLEEATRVLEWHKKAVEREVQWGIAQTLSLVLSDLVRPCKDLKNLRAKIYGILFATGLDVVNSIHSQAEVARLIDCSRALISHYTIKWADKLRLGNFKFRKAESSRQTFRDSAKKAWEKR